MDIPQHRAKQPADMVAGLAAIAQAVVLSAMPAMATDYASLPEESRLEFAAEQQGADFRGEFGTFTAELRLDDAEPDRNRLVANVSLASVDTAYAERDEYLRGEEWFDVARWPQARFETVSLEPLGGGRYRADGRLTLRDQTRPVAMDLQFDGRRLTGEATLDRREFGVGQGMWTDDRMVGAEVRVFVDVAFAPEP